MMVRGIMDTQLIKKGFLAGILLAALVLGVLVMKHAAPEKKPAIYHDIHLYSPYVLQKRMGGLEIMDKRTGEIEKPSNQEVFLRLDELEAAWGKSHLRVEGDTLFILGDHQQTITQLHIENIQDRQFLQHFFGI